MRTTKQWMQFICNAFLNMGETFRDLAKNDAYWKGRLDGQKHMAETILKFLEGCE